MKINKWERQNLEEEVRVRRGSCLAKYLRSSARERNIFDVLHALLGSWGHFHPREPKLSSSYCASVATTNLTKPGAAESSAMRMNLINCPTESRISV